MLHLRVQSIICMELHNKVANSSQKVKEKMNFMLQLMIHLTKQSKVAPEDTLESAPNEALSNFNKDSQGGA